MQYVRVSVVRIIEIRVKIGQYKIITELLVFPVTALEIFISFLIRDVKLLQIQSKGQHIHFSRTSWVLKVHKVWYFEHKGLNFHIQRDDNFQWTLNELISLKHTMLDVFLFHLFVENVWTKAWKIRNNCAVHNSIKLWNIWMNFFFIL